MTTTSAPFESEELERYLYPRGFLVTNTQRTTERILPALRKWNTGYVGNYRVFCHPDAKSHIVELGDLALIMIGHAYNPWANVADEKQILTELGKRFLDDPHNMIQLMDEVSGRFALFLVKHDSITVLHDCAGIQSVYYYKKGNEIFVSSHSGLIAEANGLAMSEEIKDLVASPFYSIGIRHLPGIKSPFEGVHLLTANTLLEARPGSLEVRRYFPRETLVPVTVEEATASIAQMLGDSVRLLLTKASVAVSLTGGLDSRMTLAATHGNENRISYFSYVSNAAEEKDAHIAEQLCQALNLDHRTYQIPSELDGHRDRAFAEIVHRNTAGVRNPKEYVKSIYMARHFPRDTVEIKSTVSEIGRKFYCKKLGVTSMPANLTPRMMSNLYKRNAFNRRLLKYMDEAFEEFISVTGFGSDFMNYDQDDMFYWEHRMSAWQSLVVQDSDYSRDTTMLFNNRKLQQIFLGVDVKYRLSDEVQRRVAETLWPEAAALPIATNTGSRSLKARLREMAERLFFMLN